jgi:thioredoxin reductase
LEEVTRMALRQRLADSKVKMSPGTGLKSIDGNDVTLTNPGGQGDRVEDFDTVILSYGGVEDNELYYALKDAFPEVYIAGDCSGVRKRLWAVNDGAEIGRQI